MNEHYKRLTPQTIDRMRDVMSPLEFQGFCRGNIIKYVERAGHKDEITGEVRKIVDYANWWLDSLIQHNNQPCSKEVL